MSAVCTGCTGRMLLTLHRVPSGLNSVQASYTLRGGTSSRSLSRRRSARPRRVRKRSWRTGCYWVRLQTLKASRVVASPHHTPQPSDSTRSTLPGCERDSRRSCGRYARHTCRGHRRGRTPRFRTGGRPGRESSVEGSQVWSSSSHPFVQSASLCFATLQGCCFDSAQRPLRCSRAARSIARNSSIFANGYFV